MKRFALLALASGMAVVAASPANATAFLVGTGTVTAPGSFTLEPGSQFRAVGTYADAFYFTLTNSAAIAASDLSSTAVGSQNLDFSRALAAMTNLDGVQLRRLTTTQNSLGLALTVAGNTGGTSTGLTTSNSTLVSAFSPTGNVAGTEGMSLGSTNLTAGTYAILVNYTITGAPAAYSGNLQLANAPAVPEPATWGMMIMGFGLMGGVLRRRSTKVAFA